jgi:hypothetical protein
MNDGGFTQQPWLALRDVFVISRVGETVVHS